MEIFWHKLLQTRRSTPVLGLVTAQGEFSDEQAEVGGDSFVPYSGPLSWTPALPSGHSPCDGIEPVPELILVEPIFVPAYFSPSDFGIFSLL